MARRIDFKAQATTPADARAVYRLLADGATWPSWTPIGRFELEAEGIDGGESAGAIRVFISGPVRSREQLVELHENEQIRYTVLSGPPMRDHAARVDLTPTGDGGTRIVWYESFEPTWPGTGPLLRWFLARFVQRCADGLAAAAQLSTDS
jgi:hypothetical protein